MEMLLDYESQSATSEGERERERESDCVNMNQTSSLADAAVNKISLQFGSGAKLIESYLSSLL